MTLNDAQNYKEYIVKESLLKQPQKRRLEAMGLIEGTIIRKINQALDGSVILVVRGTRLALGKDLANDIIVRELTPSDVRGKRRRRGLGLKNGHGGGGKGRAIGPRDGHGKGSGMGRAIGQRDGCGKARGIEKERGI